MEINGVDVSIGGQRLTGSPANGVVGQLSNFSDGSVSLSSVKSPLEGPAEFSFRISVPQAVTVVAVKLNGVQLLNAVIILSSLVPSRVVRILEVNNLGLNRRRGRQGGRRIQDGHVRAVEVLAVRRRRLNHSGGSGGTRGKGDSGNGSVARSLVGEGNASDNTCGKSGSGGGLDSIPVVRGTNRNSRSAAIARSSSSDSNAQQFAVRHSRVPRLVGGVGTEDICVVAASLHISHIRRAASCIAELGHISGRVAKLVGVIFLLTASELSTRYVIIPEESHSPSVATIVAAHVDIASAHGQVSNVGEGLELLLHRTSITSGISSARISIVRDCTCALNSLDVDDIVASSVQANCKGSSEGF
mmetsp:Transcript_14282/g.26216  ORF Transcript_14282/g.26216 Transcript_14282/m.26216 type:complete len:359 (+) Transcript_14282:13375-14451(+)